MVRVRPAILPDAEYIAEHLREEDRIEITTSTGRAPEEVLSRSYSISEECYAVFNEGDVDPCSIFGVLSDPNGGPGLVWMLCTPEVTRHVRSVLREMVGWAESFAEGYGGIQALAWTKNYLHVRWCKLLGFEECGQYLINNEIFTHLVKE